jgi:hypothetical protein
MVNRVLTALVLLINSAGFARAEAPYVDDRSSPEALIDSLYSALNRKEYARAWHYFAEPPAKSFDGFVKGYEKTALVEWTVRRPVADGAAGTIYYNIPVNLRAVSTDGTESFFVGCYTLRQVNARLVDQDFDGLAIKSGKFKKVASDSFQADGDQGCSNDNGWLDTDAVADASRAFTQQFDVQCPLVTKIKSGELRPSYWMIDSNSESTLDNVNPRVLLARFPCQMAAYNESSVYYTFSDIEGLQLVGFVSPDLEFTYQPGSNDAKLQSIRLSGFHSDHILSNSDFDAATKTIHTSHKWRGIGDAFNAASYVLGASGFSLSSYEIDPTTDELINPTTVIKNGKVVLN